MNIVNNINHKVSGAQSALSNDALTYIESFATLLSPWGLPPSAGRVLGYLFLIQQPVTIDQIANDLSMSRVSAWNSAKSLEEFDHVKRFSVRGSKRMLYAASDNFAGPLLRQAKMIGEVGSLLKNCAETLATNAAKTPINDRAKLFRSLSATMQDTIKTLEEERKRKI